MNKVNLLKAHCTLCLGVRITHISARATHTALRGCLPDTHTLLCSYTHKCYCSQGSAGVLVIEKGMGLAGSIWNCTVLMWLDRHAHFSRIKKMGKGVSICIEFTLSNEMLVYMLYYYNLQALMHEYTSTWKVVVLIRSLVKSMAINLTTPAGSFVCCQNVQVITIRI